MGTMTAMAIAHGGTAESVLQSGRYGANGSKKFFCKAMELDEFVSRDQTAIKYGMRAKSVQVI